MFIQAAIQEAYETKCILWMVSMSSNCYVFGANDVRLQWELVVVDEIRTAIA